MILSQGKCRHGDRSWEHNPTLSLGATGYHYLLGKGE